MAVAEYKYLCIILCISYLWHNSIVTTTWLIVVNKIITYLWALSQWQFMARTNLFSVSARKKNVTKCIPLHARLHSAHHIIFHFHNNADYFEEHVNCFPLLNGSENNKTFRAMHTTVQLRLLSECVCLILVCYSVSINIYDCADYGLLIRTLNTYIRLNC